MRLSSVILIVVLAISLAVDRSAAQTSASPVTAALQGHEIAPELARMQSYLQHESPLGARRYALASLVAARELNLAHTWSEHEPIALQAGLPALVIDAVRFDRPLAALAGEDALLVDFGRQLYRNRHVDAQTFAALLARFGRQGTFDAIMALTYPAMPGMLQRALDRQTLDERSSAALPSLPGVGTPIGTPGRFVPIGPKPPIPPDVHEEGWYRLPLLRRDELDARGRAVFDLLVGPENDTAPRGPVGMTLNSPELAEPVQRINTLLRVEGALSRRTAEIVVTATGREMNSQYQWIVHGAAAADAGAGQAVLDAIRDDGSLDGLDARDATAIAMTRELFREERLTPATYAAAIEQFGMRGTVEIALLIGDYLMMTSAYNALGMRLRPEQEPTLPHRAGAPIGAEWR